MKEAAVYIHPDELTPWESNPRRNEHVVEKIAQSIQEFGFAAPIVARQSDFRIVAGHTRWKAAQKLGLTSVPVRLMQLTDARKLPISHSYPQPVDN